MASFVKTMASYYPHHFFDVAFEPPVWKVKPARVIGKLLPGLLQSNELGCYQSRLVLALPVYLIDISKMANWSFPFKVIGMNPFVSFVLSIVLVKILLRATIDGKSAYGFFCGRFYQPIFRNYNGYLLCASANLLIVFAFAFWLYKRKTIIKL